MTLTSGMLRHRRRLILTPYSPEKKKKGYLSSFGEYKPFMNPINPLSRIEDFMREIDNAYPQTASLIIIGRTAEGQDGFALTISAGNHEEIVENYGERKKKKKLKRKRLGGEGGRAKREA